MGRGDRPGPRLSGPSSARRAAHGALAQLVAHLLCKQGVRGSSPLGSTPFPFPSPRAAARTPVPAAHEWHTSGVPLRPTRPRRRALVVPVVLAGLALAATGCTDSVPPPDASPPPEPVATRTVSAEAATPAQRALVHVPRDVVAVTVTDFDRAALQLGLEQPTSEWTAQERAMFWRRVAEETAAMSTGLLRPVEDRLLAEYSVGQEDVGWEARLYDRAGREVGWILGLHPLIDPRVLQRAADAGLGPLAGATVDVEAGLVLSGAAVDVAEPWSEDDGLGMLVTGDAVATYVEQGCVDGPAGGAADLDPLEAYAVALEGTLATVRLGTGRQDLFERVDLADDDAEVGAALEGGVADPGTGRLGFRLLDPVAAADLTLRRRLPMVACGS